MRQSTFSRTLFFLFISILSGGALFIVNNLMQEYVDSPLITVYILFGMYILAIWTVAAYNYGKFIKKYYL